MENSLVALMLASTLMLHSTEEKLQSANVCLGLVLGLLPAVRPEWAIFSLIYVLLAFYYRREALVKISCAAAGIWVVTSVLATYALTGFVVPQTASAKAIFLAQPLSVAGIAPIPAIVVSGSSVSIFVIAFCRDTSRRLQHWCIATVGFVATVVVYLLVGHGLISTRYATSLSSPLLLAALYCFAEYIRRNGASSKVFRRWMAVSAIIQITAICVTLWYFFPFTRSSEEFGIRSFALKTNELTKPTDRIGLTEIGVFGFYADRYIIDLVGLIDPETLKWGRLHGRPKSIDDLEELLKVRRATYYVCTFCASSRDVVGHALGFEPVYESKIMRGNASRGRAIDDPTWVLYRLHY
jgi:hypothetical protein